MYGMYEYRARLVNVVDGDTVDVDIDLGFGIWMKDERVRIMGIDTPESRTRDLEEKKFGLAAKKRITELLEVDGLVLKTQVARDGEDMKGKFGRILGDFSVHYAPQDRQMKVSEIMCLEGHAVAYFGGSKEELAQQHMDNRARLLAEGVVK
jgi:micrococcal nuclease